ncbi:unnamed protein product [Amoebophrya sp. A120]|nr:unnamed protein product [Amoebophrya sp. A120]|eukprot:GSA120T00013891001.1
MNQTSSKTSWKQIFFECDTFAQDMMRLRLFDRHLETRKEILKARAGQEKIQKKPAPVQIQKKEASLGWALFIMQKLQGMERLSCRDGKRGQLSACLGSASAIELLN